MAMEYGKESVFQFMQTGNIPNSRNVVETDMWDKENLDAIVAELKQYRLSKGDLKKVAETGGELFDDVFFTLNKYTTTAKDVKELQPSYIVNKYVEELAVELPSHAKLKLSSVNDIVASGLSCVEIEPELEKLFDKLQNEQEKAQQLQQMMMDAQQAAAEGDGEALEKLQGQMQAAAEDLDNSLEQKRVDVQQMLKEMMQKADDLNQSMENALNLTGWGLQKGEKMHLPPEERIKLAESLKDDKIKKVMELFGSFSKFAFAERAKKSKMQTDEIYDTTVGDDLSRLLPFEFLTMIDDDMDYDFTRRWMEEQLVQFKLKCKEKTQKGGIIFCEDGSGSMSGTRELWAKAVGLTMLRIAQTQKRSFYGIHFGSPGELAEFDFGEKFDHDKLMEFASIFFCSGTDFFTPLNRALELLEEEFKRDGAIGGDIVFCTDGLCDVTDDWLAHFKSRQAELGFKVYGILIGVGESPVLDKICDETYEVGSLFEIKHSGVTGVFTGV